MDIYGNGAQSGGANINSDNFVQKANTGDVDISSSSGEISFSRNGVKRMRIEADDVISLEPGVYGARVQGNLAISGYCQATEGDFDNLMDRNELADSYVSKGEKDWLKSGNGQPVILGSVDDSEVHVRQSGLACLTIPRFQQARVI